MNSSCRSCLAGPLMFLAMLAALFAVWLLMDPAALVALFDRSGRSVFELATLPVFAAIIPLVWLKCPFGGSLKRRRILSAMVTIVVLMAIVKELDLHNAAFACFFPDLVGQDGLLLGDRLVRPDGRPLGGTPFKMRVLTNAEVPLAMKCLIVAYFISFFGVFAAGFAYFFPAWIKGVLRMDGAAWSFGCMGASGVMVQIADRLPSWIRDYGIMGDSWRALCTALEEGGEMMLAIFALLTIYLGHRAISSNPLALESKKV